jgi:hypothetical protein
MAAMLDDLWQPAPATTAERTNAETRVDVSPLERHHGSVNRVVNQVPQRTWNVAKQPGAD